MPETDVTYEYEAHCEHCGSTKLCETDTEFTITVASKSSLDECDMPMDHDCEFTEFTELAEPVTLTVRY